MKRTKTFLATIAVGALALALAACGTTASADDSAVTNDAAPVVQTMPEANTAQTTLQQGGGYGQQGANGQGGHGAAHQAQGGEMDPAANLPPAGEVDDQEIADLLHMREEEKLARDVYITLGEQWDFPVFTNISKSEQQHMDAVGALLDRYGIEDPVGDNPVGVFTDPELQALYNQLVAQGSQSLAEALKVGATIEDVDIYDLQKAVADTDNADIQQVYKSLLAGSENHMRAFVGVLQQQTGETYTPQYIDQATFDAIMAASNGHGQGGHGQGGHGQGGHGGHGQGGHGQGKGGRGGQGGQAFNLTPNS
jgi:hypothetical protein